MVFSKVKGIIAGIALLLGATVTQSKAQSWSEWFSQKKTQIKYLTQQIAALQACESSLKQGYAIAKNEWGAIGSFTSGEYGLHQGYYNSLNTVNQQVKSSTDLTTIKAEQQSMISQFKAIGNLTGLSASEQAYIGSVQQNIITQCGKDLDELQMVLTSGQLQMTDDERIKRIGQITASIKDKYVFTCSFANQVRLLALQRNQDNQSIQTLNQLYGINN